MRTRHSVVALFVLALAFAPIAPGARASAQKSVGTTADLAWLAGRWEGRMTNDSTLRAETLFSAPAAGTITGVMRLISNAKEVVVVELITIIDTPNGVEMRFRHFSPSLEAYETTYQQNMRLASRNGDAFRFDNTFAFDPRLMSTQPRVSTFTRNGKDEFLAHSDVLNEGNKASVIEVKYRRAR